MSWTWTVCSKHPEVDNIEACCGECVDVFCARCGRSPDAVATFADSDEEGLRPIEVVVR